MSELLQSVKLHLRVTHDHLDEELTELVDEAKYTIDKTCGPSDYLNDFLAKSLVKTYCRYAWSGAPEMFEANNRSSLLKLQLSNGVDNYANKE